MHGFDGGGVGRGGPALPELAQFQATMLAVEQACSAIQKTLGWQTQGFRLLELSEMQLLGKKAREKVLARGKKVASRPEKRPRVVEDAPPEDSSGDAHDHGSTAISQREEERPTKCPQPQPSSPTTVPSSPPKTRVQLDPVEWGRQALPAELKADALNKSPRRLLFDFHSSLLSQLAAFEAYVHRAEVKQASPE
ncbi:hypothetical protein Taro_019697 [Colocasia esculenta]|uniref:Uncharacterized protein n=1 Tax=Colocasia esculenta TaxID=4460 RepID=A0A843UU87_COLES|nr:hypothetical protein [Colocasia esculenta]